MSERWLYAWGLAAVAFGGASLVVALDVVALGGDAFVLGRPFASASFVGVPGALVFGNLADRTGTRGVFVPGAMAVTAATMAVIPLLDAILPVVGGVTWAVIAVTAATLVSTLSPPSSGARPSASTAHSPRSAAASADCPAAGSPGSATPSPSGPPAVWSSPPAWSPCSREAT